MDVLKATKESSKWEILLDAIKNINDVKGIKPKAIERIERDYKAFERRVELQHDSPMVAAQTVIQHFKNQVAPSLKLFDSDLIVYETYSKGINESGVSLYDNFDAAGEQKINPHATLSNLTNALKEVNEKIVFEQTEKAHKILFAKEKDGKKTAITQLMEMKKKLNVPEEQLKLFKEILNNFNRTNKKQVTFIKNISEELNDYFNGQEDKLPKRFKNILDKQKDKNKRKIYAIFNDIGIHFRNQFVSDNSNDLLTQYFKFDYDTQIEYLSEFILTPEPPSANIRKKLFNKENVLVAYELISHINILEDDIGDNDIDETKDHYNFKRIMKQIENHVNVLRLIIECMKLLKIPIKPSRINSINESIEELNKKSKETQLEKVNIPIQLTTPILEYYEFSETELDTDVIIPDKVLDNKKKEKYTLDDYKRIFNEMKIVANNLKKDIKEFKPVVNVTSTMPWIKNINTIITEMDAQENKIDSFFRTYVSVRLNKDEHKEISRDIKEYVNIIKSIVPKIYFKGEPRLPTPLTTKDKVKVHPNLNLTSEDKPSRKRFHEQNPDWKQGLRLNPDWKKQINSKAKKWIKQLSDIKTWEQSFSRDELDDKSLKDRKKEFINAKNKKITNNATWDGVDRKKISTKDRLKIQRELDHSSGKPKKKKDEDFS